MIWELVASELHELHLSFKRWTASKKMRSLSQRFEAMNLKRNRRDIGFSLAVPTLHVCWLWLALSPTKRVLCKV